MNRDNSVSRETVSQTRYDPLGASLSRQSPKETTPCSRNPQTCILPKLSYSVAICRTPRDDLQSPAPAFCSPLSALKKTPPSTIGAICCAFAHDLFQSPEKHSLPTSKSWCAQTTFLPLPPPRTQASGGRKSPDSTRLAVPDRHSALVVSETRAAAAFE